MATWPVDLPSAFLLDSFTLQPRPQTLRTETDAGPPKVRRRFSAAPTNVQGAMVMSTAQLATLRAFFDQTLFGGSLTFDWLHPDTGDPAVFRFTEPPAHTSLGGQWHRVTLSLEIMP